ncbi:hypothetical protein [Streptomyces sp. NPDC046197]|uniref:hypothetical protein n=1 Tax=Streptomyces sp. NPDC046197 TaxID=3154337 RepID=UPI0033F241CE
MARASPLDSSTMDVAGPEAALREAVDAEVRFDAGSTGAYATDGSNYRSSTASSTPTAAASPPARTARPDSA